jgi:hypothetical protein
MASIVRVARNPVLIRLMVGVLVGLMSYEGTSLLIDMMGGHIS